MAQGREGISLGKDLHKAERIIFCIFFDAEKQGLAVTINDEKLFCFKTEKNINALSALQ